MTTSFLALGKHKEKVDQLEKRDRTNCEELEKLGDDMAVVKERVQNIQKVVGILVDTTKSHSPISLTDKGWSLLKDSSCYDIFEENRDRHLEELEKLQPRSQYDVQEKAYALMGDKFNADEFKSLKKWAFDNGKTLDEIVRLCGYPLRDYYFEKHPEVVNPNEQY